MSRHADDQRVEKARFDGLQLPQDLWVSRRNVSASHGSEEEVSPDVCHNVPQITPSQGIMALRLKLYDEASGRLVSFKEATAAHELQAAVAG